MILNVMCWRRLPERPWPRGNRSELRRVTGAETLRTNLEESSGTTEVGSGRPAGTGRALARTVSCGLGDFACGLSGPARRFLAPATLLNTGQGEWTQRP